MLSDTSSCRERVKKKAVDTLEVGAREVNVSMDSEINKRMATYLPVSYKSSAGALNAFFKNEISVLGGDRVRMTVVREINAMASKFFPYTTNLRPGQTPWVTVGADLKEAYGKRIQVTELVPVTLDIVSADDAAERAAGKKLKDMKKEACARLCKQA